MQQRSSGGDGRAEDVGKATDAEPNRPADLRVAMVTYLFPPTFAGGARHAIELAKALRPRGVESVFVGANLEKAPEHEIYEGFPVYRIPSAGPTRVGYLQYAWRVSRRLFALRRTVRLVHLHSVRPFYFLIVACCKILGMPVVQSPTLVGHDDPATLRTQSKLWRLEGLTYRHYDRVVCKSTAIRRSCVEAGLPDERLIQIPGAVPCGTPESPFRPARDREEVERTRERLGLPRESFITTFVGRIQRRKGSDLLFDAWERLIRDPSFEGHLLLVGPAKQPTNGANTKDREFAARVEAFRAAAGEKRVIFAGDVDHDAVPDYLRVSDCFVFPSLREGLPKAPIEAMATGLPVICSLIPGVTEDLIDDGTDGLVLRDRRADELARMIESIRRDPALRERLSTAAQEKVRRVFAIDIVADRHLELYHELIG